jgi:hypothetical protein
MSANNSLKAVSESVSSHLISCTNSENSEIKPLKSEFNLTINDAVEMYQKMLLDKSDIDVNDTLGSLLEYTGTDQQNKLIIEAANTIGYGISQDFSVEIIKNFEETKDKRLQVIQITIDTLTFFSKNDHPISQLFYTTIMDQIKKINLPLHDFFNEKLTTNSQQGGANGEVTWGSKLARTASVSIILSYGVYAALSSIDPTITTSMTQDFNNFVTRKWQDLIGTTNQRVPVAYGPVYTALSQTASSPASLKQAQDRKDNDYNMVVNVTAEMTQNQGNLATFLLTSLNDYNSGYSRESMHDFTNQIVLPVAKIADRVQNDYKALVNAKTKLHEEEEFKLQMEENKKTWFWKRKPVTTNEQKRYNSVKTSIEILKKTVTDLSKSSIPAFHELFNNSPAIKKYYEDYLTSKGYTPAEIKEALNDLASKKTRFGTGISLKKANEANPDSNNYNVAVPIPFVPLKLAKNTLEPETRAVNQAAVNRSTTKVKAALERYSEAESTAFNTLQVPEAQRETFKALRDNTIKDIVRIRSSSMSKEQKDEATLQKVGNLVSSVPSINMEPPKSELHALAVAELIESLRELVDAKYNLATVQQTHTSLSVKLSKTEHTIFNNVILQYDHHLHVLLDLVETSGDLSNEELFKKMDAYLTSISQVTKTTTTPGKLWGEIKTVEEMRTANPLIRMIASVLRQKALARRLELLEAKLETDRAVVVGIVSSSAIKAFSDFSDEALAQCKAYRTLLKHNETSDGECESIISSELVKMMSIVPMFTPKLEMAESFAITAWDLKHNPEKVPMDYQNIIFANHEGNAKWNQNIGPGAAKASKVGYKIAQWLMLFPVFLILAGGAYLAVKAASGEVGISLAGIPFGFKIFSNRSSDVSSSQQPLPQASQQALPQPLPQASRPASGWLSGLISRIWRSQPARSGGTDVCAKLASPSQSGGTKKVSYTPYTPESDPEYKRNVKSSNNDSWLNNRMNALNFPSNNSKTYPKNYILWNNGEQQNAFDNKMPKLLVEGEWTPFDIKQWNTDLLYATYAYKEQKNIRQIPMPSPINEIETLDLNRKLQGNYYNKRKNCTTLNNLYSTLCMVEQIAVDIGIARKKIKEQGITLKNNIDIMTSMIKVHNENKESFKIKKEEYRSNIISNGNTIIKDLICQYNNSIKRQKISPMFEIVTKNNNSKTYTKKFALTQFQNIHPTIIITNGNSVKIDNQDLMNFIEDVNRLRDYFLHYETPYTEYMVAADNIRVAYNEIINSIEELNNYDTELEHSSKKLEDDLSTLKRNYLYYKQTVFIVTPLTNEEAAKTEHEIINNKNYQIQNDVETLEGASGVKKKINRTIYSANVSEYPTGTPGVKTKKSIFYKPKITGFSNTVTIHNNSINEPLIFTDGPIAYKGLQPNGRLRNNQNETRKKIYANPGLRRAVYNTKEQPWFNNKKYNNSLTRRGTRIVNERPNNNSDLVGNLLAPVVPWNSTNNQLIEVPLVQNSPEQQAYVIDKEIQQIEKEIANSGTIMGIEKTTQYWRNLKERLQQLKELSKSLRTPKQQARVIDDEIKRIEQVNADIKSGKKSEQKSSAAYKLQLKEQSKALKKGTPIQEREVVEFGSYSGPARPKYRNEAMQNLRAKRAEYDSATFFQKAVYPSYYSKLANNANYLEKTIQSYPKRPASRRGGYTHKQYRMRKTHKCNLYHKKGSIKNKKNRNTRKR